MTIVRFFLFFYAWFFPNCAITICIGYERGHWFREDEPPPLCADNMDNFAHTFHALLNRDWDGATEQRVLDLPGVAMVRCKL